MARRKLGELLVEAGVIDVMQLQSGLGEQKKWGRPLGQTLVDLGFLHEITLVQALSSQLNIPAVDLQNVVAQAQALQWLEAEFCQANACFPFGFESSGSFLDVAMADPTNPELFDLIRVQTRCNIRPHLAGHRAIDQAIRRDYLGEMPATELEIEDRPWHDDGYAQAPEGQRRRRPSQPLAPETPEPSLMPEPAADRPPGRRRPPTSERPAASAAARDQLLMQLHETVRQLVANLERDEKVIRKLMSLMVEKGVCTRAEIVAKIYEE